MYLEEYSSLCFHYFVLELEKIKYTRIISFVSVNECSLKSKYEIQKITAVTIRLHISKSRESTYDYMNESCCYNEQSAFVVTEYNEAIVLLKMVSKIFFQFVTLMMATETNGHISSVMPN